MKNCVKYIPIINGSYSLPTPADDDIWRIFSQFLILYKYCGEWS